MLQGHVLRNSAWGPESHASVAVSLHIQTLAAINAEKYRALDRVFHGLTALAILAIALIGVIVFSGLAM